MTQLLILLSIAFTFSVNALSGNAASPNSSDQLKSAVAESQTILSFSNLEESDGDFDDVIDYSKPIGLGLSPSAAVSRVAQNNHSPNYRYLKPIRAPPLA